MNPFRCKIVAIDTRSPFEGRLTILYAGKLLDLRVCPLSLFLPWIKNWKPGDDAVCRVNENCSCAITNGSSSIDLLPVESKIYEILRGWATGVAANHGSVDLMLPSF